MEALYADESGLMTVLKIREDFARLHRTGVRPEEYRNFRKEQGVQYRMTWARGGMREAEWLGYAFNFPRGTSPAKLEQYEMAKSKLLQVGKIISKTGILDRDRPEDYMRIRVENGELSEDWLLDENHSDIFVRVLDPSRRTLITGPVKKS